MTKPNEIYKCNVCGNIVSVIEAHDGILVCCNQAMNLMEAKSTVQEGNEKHVPIVKIEGDKVVVNVGSIDHPMMDAHWIQLIQLLRNNSVIAEKRLKPGEKPQAEFCLTDTSDITARELCNLHGLWKSE
jgi:superoxide reductase